jgi:predicted Zn-dependent protease
VAEVWEKLGVTAEEIEMVILMHELGHAIGIIRYNEEGCEIPLTIAMQIQYATALNIGS